MWITSGQESHVTPPPIRYQYPSFLNITPINQNQKKKWKATSTFLLQFLLKYTQSAIITRRNLEVSESLRKFALNKAFKANANKTSYYYDSITAKRRITETTQLYR